MELATPTRPVDPAPRPQPDLTLSWFRPLVPTALGNCVVDHIAIGKLKARTGQRVGLVFWPEIDFHAELLAANPYLDEACPVREFPADPATLPEPTRGRTWNYLIENTEIARLCVDPDDQQEVDELLVARGICPGDEILAIHAREPGYKYYAKDHEPERFVEVQAFIEVAEHYLARGLKVVRIGDPSCTPFPRHPGLFDAAHWPNKRLGHDMAIIQRARVLLATDSGIWPLGVALGTPTVLSNSCHGQPAMGAQRHWFPWEPGHLVLNKHLVALGRELSAREGVELFRGARWRPIPGKVELYDNTVAELIDAVERLRKRQKGASR